MECPAIFNPSELRLPQPPSPSADPGIIPCTEFSDNDTGNVPSIDELDVFTLTALAAMKLLCRTADILVRISGGVALGSPISQSSILNPGHDEENLIIYSKDGMRASGADDVPMRAKTPIGSPEAGISEPLQAVDHRFDRQQDAVIRKFYSKKPPPISVEDYLMRLHKYCPMSTGVYLASSLYIWRLALIEKILPVTTRNVHRLVLAALRVAMKALEDLSYPHRRFAKVGGISEQELGRLEISFCFVTRFELRVDDKMLLKHANLIQAEDSLNRNSPQLQGLLALSKQQSGGRERDMPAKDVAIDIPVPIG